MSQHHAPREDAAARPPMPAGIHNVYIFEVFNTASWSVALGAPMLLFLQHLNATATIMALAACLAPVLNILQIPAARFVEQVGYRRFVLSGWMSRSVFLVGMTLIAFIADWIDRTTCIVAMLFCSFGFNILRGISVCGVLPWFTSLVPEARRGEFLSRDQMAGALASVCCLFLFGLILSGHEVWYSFGIVFLFGTISALLSLPFLQRIPDVKVEKIVQNAEPMPWKKMFFYPPFFKYLCYNSITNMALGTSGVFWVRYFRSFLHISESNVLFIAALTTIVLASGLFLTGPLIDRAGNKPVLTCSGLLFICHFLGWSGVAAGIFPLNKIMVMIQIITSGLAQALWNLANVRTVMGIVPVMGRPHFLALYSVVANLSVGLIPLFWGPIMDGLTHWRVEWGIWQWNCYSLLYFVLALTVMVGLGLLRRVEEPKTMTWDVFMTELLVKTPSRAISRVVSRLRGPGIG